MRIRAICIAVLTACTATATHAADIRAVTIREGATGTRAEIALSAPADYTLIHLQGPDRLVVDLPASSILNSASMPKGTGAVARVRSGQPVPGTVRLVFDLAQSVAALAPRIEQGAAGPTLVIEWPGDGKVAALPAKTVVVSAGTEQPTSASTAPPTSTSAPVIRDDVAQVAASADATSKLIAAMRAGTASPAPTSTSTPTPSAVGVTAPAASAAVPVAKPPSPTIERVIASATTPAVATPSPTLPPAAGTTPAVASITDASTVTTLPGRIATGVPTRIATGVPSPSATPPVQAASKPVAAASRARGSRSLVIAIDPGHGGQDPGAVGLNGNREKDVTLAISRELARQINATPGLKAFLTRDADMYIPLGNRARLARGAKADMFISIHADAAENRSARGSSVYVLSLKGASSQRARWLADKENRSDLIGGARYKQADTMLTSVLLDLTQSGHMRASEDAGTEILSGLKRIGNHHKPHIERANFAVLRTSDMPSMLVETAFISNPEEEKRLVDPAFQKQLARAVLDGVDTYFKRQPPPGTLYAARAAEVAVASTVGGAP